jgi:hypothetical protein
VASPVPKETTFPANLIGTLDIVPPVEGFTTLSRSSSREMEYRMRSAWATDGAKPIKIKMLATHAQAVSLIDNHPPVVLNDPPAFRNF